MTRIAPWVAAALLLCPLVAQGSKPPATDPAVKARLDELNTEYDKILADWQAAREQAAKAAEQAAAEGKPVPAMPMRPDFGPLAGKYIAAAKSFAGEDAMQFLLRTLNCPLTPEQNREVFDMIFTDHLDGEAVNRLGSMLQYLDRIIDADYQKAVFAKIEKHGKNPTLLGWLEFTRRADVLRSNAPTSKEFLGTRDALRAAAENAGDKGLTREIESLIAEQEKFGTGMAAPDIAGKDLDGVDFKLSDYKGKVLFVDFWGDW
ncbi:MAG: hypothetical protein U1E73_04720 [Planctomycetota bacterium]